jgi:uroporphyrinogen-III synthase
VSSELADGGYDTVLLTSPSTVTALAGIDIAASTVLGAIGRPTSKAAAAAGRPVQFAAGRPTATGLVDSLVEFALAHHRQPRARET